MPRIPRDFDNKTIYNDIKSAIHADKLYWIRNDAKIRACYTSQNYDEFRDIVAAAHLTSVCDKDKINKAGKSWNTLATPQDKE